MRRCGYLGETGSSSVRPGAVGSDPARGEDADDAAKRTWATLEDVDWR